jgi:hypothetical protein
MAMKCKWISTILLSRDGAGAVRYVARDFTGMRRRLVLRVCLRACPPACRLYFDNIASRIHDDPLLAAPANLLHKRRSADSSSDDL